MSQLVWDHSWYTKPNVILQLLQARDLWVDDPQDLLQVD